MSTSEVHDKKDHYVFLTTGVMSCGQLLIIVIVWSAKTLPASERTPAKPRTVDLESMMQCFEMFYFVGRGAASASTTVMTFDRRRDQERFEAPFILTSQREERDDRSP